MRAQTLYQKAFINTGNSGMGGAIAWSAYDRTYVFAMVEGDSAYQDLVRITKIDSTGNPVWAQTLAYPNDRYVGFPNICVGNNGMIYCVGYYQEGFSGRICYYVTALYAWGTISWCNIYEAESAFPVEHPSIKCLPDGNLLLFEPVDYCGIIKLDPQGNVLSASRVSENSSGNGFLYGHHSAVAPDGSIYMAAELTGSLALIKTDSAGVVLWSKLWQRNDPFHIRGIQVFPDGLVVVSGYCGAGAFLAGIAGDSMLWFKAFAALQFFGDMALLNDSAFVVSGLTPYNSMSFSVFDRNGNFVNGIKAPVVPGNAYHGYPRVVVNPQHIITGLFEFSHGMVCGMAVLITDTMGTTGCNLEAGMQQELTEPMPAEAGLPVYRNITTVTHMPFAFGASSMPQTFIDLCYVLHTEESPPATSPGLHLRNSATMNGEQLMFTLGNYSGAYSYTVFDLSGKIVVAASGSCTGAEQVSIPGMQQQQNGVYLLQVVTGNGVFAERFAIAK